MHRTRLGLFSLIIPEITGVFRKFRPAGANFLGNSGILGCTGLGSPKIEQAPIRRLSGRVLAGIRGEEAFSRPHPASCGLAIVAVIARLEASGPPFRV